MKNCKTTYEVAKQLAKTISHMSKFSDCEVQTFGPTKYCDESTVVIREKGGHIIGDINIHPSPDAESGFSYGRSRMEDEWRKEKHSVRTYKDYGEIYDALMKEVPMDPADSHRKSLTYNALNKNISYDTKEEFEAAVIKLYESPFPDLSKLPVPYEQTEEYRLNSSVMNHTNEKPLPANIEQAVECAFEKQRTILSVLSMMRQLTDKECNSLQNLISAGSSKNDPIPRKTLAKRLVYLGRTDDIARAFDRHFKETGYNLTLPRGIIEKALNSDVSLYDMHSKIEEHLKGKYPEGLFTTIMMPSCITLNKDIAIDTYHLTAQQVMEMDKELRTDIPKLIDELTDKTKDKAVQKQVNKDPDIDR